MERGIGVPSHSVSGAHMHAQTFLDNYNDGMIFPSRLDAASEDADALKQLVEDHLAHTGSARARAVLDMWEEALPFFWAVRPNTHPLKKDSQAMQHIPNWDMVRRDDLKPVGKTLDQSAMFGRYGAETVIDSHRKQAMRLLKDT